MAVFQAPLAASPTSLPGCWEASRNEQETGERMAGLQPRAGRVGPQALVKLAGEEPGEVSN